MLMAGQACASGFALIEQGSGLGNAFAGGAASAEDAATVFYNPAGMSRLDDSQISVGGAFIKPSAQYSGTISGLAPLQTAGTGTGGDAGGMAFVPNMYYTRQIDDKMHAGIGINAPFGLQTDYDATWMGRFQAVKSKIQTINLNPSISYDVSDTLSVGAGLSYQHISGELTNRVNYSAAIYQATSGATAIPNLEGLSTLTGSDSGWGYNFGALFNLSPKTRVGAAYRSQIKYKLSGDVKFANRPAALAAALPDQAVTLDITMPDSFSMSAVHQYGDKLEVMADATWTGWSVFKTLDVKKTNGTSLGAATPENWKDTWRVSVGTSYHYSEQWTARAGLAFDQAPVSDAYRTVRIPDADRTWLALGGQYKTGQAGTIDFGYAHLFVKSGVMNQSASANADLAGKGYLVGSYSSSVDIVSVQYGYKF
ncbi:MAG: outer membrane protein transport protein [Pseudomonadota bacterium]